MLKATFILASFLIATASLADDKEITLTQSELSKIINAAVAQARAQDAASLAKPVIEKVQNQLTMPPAATP